MGGCGESTPDAGLLSYTSVIKTDKINQELSQATPISRRSTFGSFTINSASIVPGRSGNRVVLMTNFSLTTFEIPEGVEGALVASCGLRYDKQSRQIYLTDIRPGALRVDNASLAEYVSKGAKSGIKSIVRKVFSDIPIYTMDKSFAAKFVKKIGVYKGNIVVVYGL
jgi:hypothetical protein